MIELFITNRTALSAKYGARLPEIEQAFNVLVARRCDEGLGARIIAIDEETTMRALGTRAVVSRCDAADNKRAIDEVCDALAPDLLTILGGPDVVPHQRLRNPVPEPDDVIPTDLPYACATPYGEDPEAFAEPIRAVGRVPGLTGKQHAEFLLRPLATAAQARPKPVSRYSQPFVLSATSFAGSTQVLIDQLFKRTDGFLCPPFGPHWPRRILGRRLHVFNCHGRLADPSLRGGGRHGVTVPALFSRDVPGRISEGTVAVVESCYGGHLYEPLGSRDVPLPNAYLASGAYGFYGSTTACHGGYAAPRDADAPVRGFVEALLRGKTLGESWLEGVRSVHRAAGRIPAGLALKTLCQFLLLGDSAIRPARLDPP